ncbi:DNA-directed RNA polymerase I subunit RPA1 [Dermatophagoides pteronyssinus]|uniref:DNA-directed RNA polymerase subunit n=1 Tax=Dermatophagoides pteronyssinus TaxID=6956 RepID=A0ABQ8JVX5_DERPT|nr:DNA-directed RNA polymerase I subunit RPA1 [Dermatophagoides pteronyssinus]
MNHSISQITSVKFKLFAESEAKKLSVLPISNAQVFDPLGHPLDNSLADTSLGPLKRNDFCKTCGLTDFECLGHFGHIQLPLPVFNPFLLKHVFQVLKMFCFNCHRLLFTPFNVEIYIAQLRALDLGLDYILDDILQYANDISQSFKSFDWGSSEGQTFLRSKLTELINSECRNNKKKNMMEKNEINDKNMDDNNVVQLESIEIVNSKNVIEKKQHLFKDLISLKIIKPTKVCTRCNSRKRGLNVINKSSIVMTTGTRMKNVTDMDETIGVENRSSKSIEMKGKSYLTPAQAREHLRKLWVNEKDVLIRLLPFLDIDFNVDNSIPNECPMDVFFWETIVVTPNRFRPLRHMNGKSFEHHQTTALSELMLVAKSLEIALDSAKKTNMDDNIERFYRHWLRLQILCNRIYDIGMDNLPDKKSIGVKQILEKKEGLMRKNMMGKRVNFAARSVISPDPYIRADEIGVPLVFATRLSYPQPLTDWNVKQLQEMIINGPNQHPGALSITYEDGYTVRLKPDDINQRRSIAATLQPPSFHPNQGMQGVKIVNRHLITGDVLLVNRQPTLHKPSIMAHRARVLPKEKTLRLHYANCKCYNADFDGDEMNAHFPQSELARSEAYNIASVNYQFLVPKDGSPLSGLIQDHIVAGVLLSTRGRFFNKKDYQELIYGALSFLTNKSIKFLPPTIIKPEYLWSGKQIISTLLLNIIPANKPLPTFQIESKVSTKLLISEKPRSWTAGGPLGEKDMCESQVIFHHGELLCGIMDKVSFGANKNGLIHVCYELYGGDIHSLLLTAIARLCTNYLQSHHGFTLGIHDILIKSKPDAKRKKIIRTSKSLGMNAIVEAFQIPIDSDDVMVKSKFREAHTARDNDFMMKQLDAAYKSQTDSANNEITKICMPKGLVKSFPANNLQMMIQTGAKGGSVNAIQISCLLGQIELEGRRIPLMMSGRTLPSFRPYDTQPRAGGFVTGRFLSGIRPQEFFFHCMAGREGLIDTAVKTSRSGYLQRCLIKHLEGLIVNYDLTVRDSEGSVIQWLYGEDGLDILKSQSLKKPFFPTILNNREALKASKNEMEKLTLIRNPTLMKQIQRVKKFQKSIGNQTQSTKTSPFSVFEHQKRQNNLMITNDELKQMWYDQDVKQRQMSINRTMKSIEPIIPRYRPDLNLGAISEMLDKIVEDYVHSGLKNEPKNVINEFRQTMNVCYMRSLCAPGEAVGLLAAQSIGEPSTQMTLNTFHFAGRGEMNVTLGVPRLRELLVTASSHISTPSMDIPFRTDIDPSVNIEEEAEKVRLRLNAVRLKDVLEFVDINEHIEIGSSNSFGDRSRIYTIRFGFLPKSYYKRRYFTTPSKVLHYVETIFIRQFIEALNRRLRLLTQSSGLFDTKSTRLKSGNQTKKKTIVDGDEEEMMQQENDDNEDGDDGNDNDNDDQTSKKKKSLIDDDDDDDDEDFDDYDVDEGEGDTVAMRQRTRLNQEQEYEEPDQDEIEEQEDDIDDDQESKENDNQYADILYNLVQNPIIKSEPVDNDDDEEIVANETNVSSLREQRLAEKQKNLEAAAEERKKRVLNKSPGCIMDYSFDTSRELWCEFILKFPLISAKLDLRTIVEEESFRAFIHRVGRIDRAFLVKDNDAAQKNLPFCKLIKTEGVSVPQVVEFERFLDLRRIYTNDMHAIARTYGIEAARAALIREIKNVFAPYGISVDSRHLLLIADHMTFTGSIKGMNRGAMDGISPLQAMTFETTTNFLKNSLLLGLNDDLQSPSARLVIGRPTVVGTGLFETRLKPKMVTELIQPNLHLGTSLQRHSYHPSTSFLGQPSTSRSLFGRFSNVNRQSSFLSPSMFSPNLFSSASKDKSNKSRKRSKPDVDKNDDKTSTPIKEEIHSDIEETNLSETPPATKKMKKSKKLSIKSEFD